MDLLDLQLASGEKLQLIAEDKFLVFQLRIELRIEGNLGGIVMEEFGLQGVVVWIMGSGCFSDGDW